MASVAHEHHEHEPRASRWRTPTFWLFVLFALVGAAFLLTKHEEHVWQYLPYALLLACPFLHLFGHRGHGGGH